MLQAYIDDSGSERTGEIFVLAGVVSTAERWARFSEEWTALCDEEPKVPDFHMSIAHRLTGGYWGDGPIECLKRRRDAKLLSLASLVAKHGLVKVHSAMAWRAYESAARNRVPPEIDQPYFFLFWRVLQAVAQWQAKTGRCEQVDFTFDDQGKIGKRAAGWYRHFLDALSENEKVILSSRPIFRHDRDLPPLKAADMCAWYLRREVLDKNSSIERKEQYVRTAPMNTLWSMEYAALDITERDIREIIAAVEHTG